MFALASMFFAGLLAAQDTSYRIIASYNEERPMSKYISKEQAVNYPEISAMALLAFQKNFSNVAEVKWSLVENKYMARFINEGRKTRMLFDKKGEVIYSVTEGNEKSLPADVRKAVKSIYYDYQITFTAEVHSMDKTAWIVNLEDETSLVTVKVVDGEVIETGNYRKSK
jgi:hypothetical protein